MCSCIQDHEEGNHVSLRIRSRPDELNKHFCFHSDPLYISNIYSVPV